MSNEPIFTDHAAAQILARNIDPKVVIAVAKNAIRLGQDGTVEGRGIKLVMDANVIITVYKADHKPDAAIRSRARIRHVFKEVERAP